MGVCALKSAVWFIGVGQIAKPPGGGLQNAHQFKRGAPVLRRESTVNKVLRVGAALTLVMGSRAGLAEPSLCTRLAEEARRAPASTWSRLDPLFAWVRPAAAAAPSAIVDAVARDPRWREAVGAPHDRPLDVRKLAGLPVYMASEYGGTANCQTLVLVEALPGRAARELQPPFTLDGMNLCVTESARFAQVLGHPALVVGGAPTMTSPDIRYRIAGRSSRAWTGLCSIEIRRQTTLSLGQRFCLPGAQVCDNAQPTAQRLAASYEDSRVRGQPLDVQAFNGGRQPDAATLAVFGRFESATRADKVFNPPFPVFGADERWLDPMLTVFSNADPRVLPVLVQGQWWLAIVGRSGVGWREGGALLVALFKPPGGADDGVASYQFRTGPAGLAEVIVRDE